MTNYVDCEESIQDGSMLRYEHTCFSLQTEV